MLKSAPLLFVTFLVSCSSCKRFNWDARPYVGNSVDQELVNAEGETVRCDQPAFDSFTCFDPENLAELKTAIDRINSKKLREKLQRKYNNLALPIGLTR